MALPAEKPRYTLADVLTWDENERAEIIDGEVVMMAPAPDMVVKILSPSTQRHDRFTKFSLYQRAGVREYWIVDPDSRTAQSFILEDGHYSVKEFGTAGDKMTVNVLEDCVIDLSEIFPE